MDAFQKKVYLKVKIDGLPIPKGRLVKGPKINQYVDTCAIYCCWLLYKVGPLPVRSGVIILGKPIFFSAGYDPLVNILFSMGNTSSIRVH